MGTTDPSTSRLHSDHSDCTAAIGCTPTARAQLARGDFAQAEVAHLARGDQFGHGADGLLDRHCDIDPVLVIEVDDVGAEPAQTRLARLPDVAGVAPDRGRTGWSRGRDEPELRCHYDLVAKLSEQLREQHLVRAGSVVVRGVPEVDPDLESAPEDGERLGLVPRAVAMAHAHAAEPLRGNGRTGRSQRGPIHGSHGI